MRNLVVSRVFLALFFFSSHARAQDVPQFEFHFRLEDLCEPPDSLTLTHPIPDIVYVVTGRAMDVPLDIFAIEPGLCQIALQVDIEQLPGRAPPITVRSEHGSVRDVGPLRIETSDLGLVGMQ